MIEPSAATGNQAMNGADVGESLQDGFRIGSIRRRIFYAVGFQIVIIQVIIFPVVLEIGFFQAVPIVFQVVFEIGFLQAIFQFFVVIGLYPFDGWWRCFLGFLRTEAGTTLHDAFVTGYLLLQHLHIVAEGLIG